MAGIQGISGIPEPVQERPASIRDRKRDESLTTTSSDQVGFSSAAQEAATAAQYVQVAKSSTDVRADRVAAAKQNIENGSYKQPEILQQLAQNLMKFFE